MDCHEELAVVLLSGGMDSTTVLAIAIEAGYIPAPIHFDYRQKNRHKEQIAFEAIVNHYKISNKLVVSTDFLAQIGSSALTEDSIPIPVTPIDPAEIPSTYVPFRNGILLSMAASWAEVIGARAIFTGFVEEDSSGYPDCREKFVNAMESAVNLGRKPRSILSIITPIIHLTKSEILKVGYKLKVPYHLTWSCYTGNDTQCGVCPACRLRKKAFTEIGIPDPVGFER
jgi:7-cyano-7-deazaguanine synthase